MENQHDYHHQKGTAAAPFPASPQELPPQTGPAGVFLQVCSREHPDLLYLCVVCVLHRAGEKCPAESSKISSEDNRLPPPLHGRAIQHSLPKEGSQDTEGPNPPGSRTFCAAPLRETVQGPDCTD